MQTACKSGKRACQGPYKGRAYWENDSNRTYTAQEELERCRRENGGQLPRRSAAPTVGQRRQLDAPLALAVARPVGDKGPAGKQAEEGAGTLVVLANNIGGSTEDGQPLTGKMGMLTYIDIYKPVLEDLLKTSMRGPMPSLFCKTLNLKAAVNARVHPMDALRCKGGAPNPVNTAKETAFNAVVETVFGRSLAMSTSHVKNTSHLPSFALEAPVAANRSLNARQATDATNAQSKRPRVEAATSHMAARVKVNEIAQVDQPMRKKKRRAPGAVYAGRPFVASAPVEVTAVADDEEVAGEMVVEAVAVPDDDYYADEVLEAAETDPESDDEDESNNSSLQRVHAVSHNVAVELDDLIASLNKKLSN